MRHPIRRNDSTSEADEIGTGLNAYADRALSRLKHLYEISKLLTNIESIEITAPAIFGCMSSTLPMRTAVIVQKRRGATQVTTWATEGVSSNQITRAEQRVKVSLDSLLEGTFTNSPSVRNATATMEAASTEPMDKDSHFIFIPLVVRSSPIFGALQIESVETFNEEDLTFVNTLANQLAMALHRHFLWQTELLARIVAENTSAMAAEELALSNAELEQFASIASHDLNEPLRAVTSFLGLLERRNEGKLDKESLEFIAFAVDGAKRMRALIDDLLNLSKVRTGGKDLILVDLNIVAKNVLLNLKIAIEESGANVTFEPLPSVLGDPTQLGQLLQNLISNSLKYRGSQSPSVHISCEKKEGRWLFTVKDNGIGIDMQYAEQVFEAFQRLHDRSKYDGTGLGLAVCKKIVHRNGGKIWVDSEPGKGSCFCFTLPCIVPSLAPRLSDLANKVIPKTSS